MYGKEHCHDSEYSSVARQWLMGWWLGGGGGYCEHSNDRSDYIQSEEFIDKSSCYPLLKDCISLCQ